MLVTAALVTSPTLARAGAWPQETQHWLVITQFDYAQTDVQGYDQQGRPAGRGTFKQFEVSPYIEYGVTPDWTVGLQPRFQTVSLKDGTAGSGHSTGAAQINLFARYTFYKWDFDVVSFQAQFDTPGIASRDRPRVAEPNAEYEARALYGHAFELPWGGVTGYLDVQAAFRGRPGANSDQIRLDTTVGVRPDNDWLILFQPFFTFGLHDAKRGGSDYDLYRFELSVVRRLTDSLSVQFGGWHDAGGRNIALGNAVVAAIWYRF